MMLLQQLSSPKPGLSVAFMRCDLIQADLTFSRSIPICFNRMRRILHDGDRAGFVRDSFFRDSFVRDGRFVRDRAGFGNWTIAFGGSFDAWAVM
jgi:hypothetical protein